MQDILNRLKSQWMSALENKKLNTKWVLKSWILASYGPASYGDFVKSCALNFFVPKKYIQKGKLGKFSKHRVVTVSQNCNVRLGQLIANQDWKNWYVT